MTRARFLSLLSARRTFPKGATVLLLALGLLLGGATTARAAAPPKRPKNVPKKSLWYHGSWYAIYEGNVSWKDAKKKCEAVGGILATVPDQATWTALTTLIPGGDYWLGATDEVKEGDWKWVDGTTMTFTAWRGGEPNNLNNAENYLSSPWADLPVSSSWIKGWVCQWKSFEALMDFRVDAEDQNAELADTMKHFRQEVLTGAEEAHRAAVKAADDAYLTAIGREMDYAGKKGDTTLALALREEQQLIQKGEMLPGEDEDKTAPTLAKLRKTYREQCEKADDDRVRKIAPVVRKYDPLLDKLQAKVLRDGAPEQAVGIRIIRQSLQAMLVQ